MKVIYSLKTVIVLFLLAVSFPAYSQQVLTGIVRDAEGPMIGVTVSIQNENNRMLLGGVTNENGEYYLTIPNVKGLSVVYSFIGYKTYKVPYKGQKVQNVRLVEDIAELEQVIISAKRIDVNDNGVPIKDLGVARQKIDMDEMKEMQATSIEDALQGRLANVDIIASSGDPGSKMAIRIRGTSSLNANNEPLVVVDGIPYDTEINDDFDFQTANEEDYGALVNIAPSDIESIEVLKDAAATAIWGSRGANGVLVITTKRGTRGKTRFSISQKVDYKQEPKRIPMLNGEQYITMVQDAMWNRLHDIGFSWNEMDKLTSYPEINYDPQFKYFKEYSQNTDWLDLIKSDVLSSETNFSMSGGGDRALYRFSLGYLTENGTTKGTAFKRLSSRLNIDYRFSDRLRVAAGFSYTRGARDNNWTNPRAHAKIKMPNMSPWLLDDNGNPTNEYFIPTATSSYKPFQGTWSGSFNPVAMVNDSYNNTISNDVRVTFNLKYRLLEGLSYDGNIGFDINSSKNKKFLPQSATGVNASHADFNRGEDLMSDHIAINIYNKLIFNRTFGVHKVILTGMSQISHSANANHSTAVSGLGSANMIDPTSGGKITTLGSGSSKSRTVAFLFIAHYNYHEKYMASVGYRYEGNSKMGLDSRWGGFPSVDAAWRINKEGFLSDQEWINELKVRYSWGKNGNAPSSNYAYVGTFSPCGEYLNNSAIAPNNIQLNNLKWEMGSQHNFGIDFTAWENKVDLKLEYYIKKSEDLLQSNVSIPSSTGFPTVKFFNSGSMENKGWEIMLSLNDIVKVNDFRVSFNMNLSRNRNRVLTLPVNKNYWNYTKVDNGTYAQNVVEGDPLGSFYGYKYLGVYQSEDETIARDADGKKIMGMDGKPVYTMINNVQMRPGDAKYADLNHDGVIDEYDITYLGNSMPIVTAGFGLNLRWRDLRVRTFFQSRFGQSVINKTRMNSESMYNANNQSTAVLKRWRHPGDNTDIPRALWGRGYNYLGSDRFVDNATFFRMKQLTVSYSLPKTLLKKTGLTRTEIYVTAYDLLTLTKYKGQNPEVGIPGGIYPLAIDNADTPRPVRIALGLTLDF